MKLGERTLSIPLIQGGMGVGISLGNLAGTVAYEGCMGTISTANPGYVEDDFWENCQEANSRALRREIIKAKEIAQGKGLVAINAMVATKDYKSAIETAISCGIDAIISGAGLPLELPLLVKNSDVLIAPIVSSGRAASTICKVWKKRYDRKPDFIVLEGSQAGGHLGFAKEELTENTAKPLSELLVDVLEAIKPYGEIPIFVAGGVFNSDEIKNYISMGAAGVQIATRFIATEECDAAEGFKQTILSATNGDATIIKSPVGLPGRALKTPLIDKILAGERVIPSRCADCLVPCNVKETPYCITKALIEAVKGNYEDGLFFCGAKVGDVNKMVTVKELIDELMADWRTQ